MHRDRSAADDPYQSLATRLDHLVVPIALGCLSMLAIVQGVLQVPTVHRAVNGWRTGFQVVTSTSSQKAPANANLELSLTPLQTSNDVTVLVDGRQLTSFAYSSVVNISVQSHQHITIQNSTNHLIYVSVTQSDAGLLVPAPGQRVVVGPNSLANFPAVRFQ